MGLGALAERLADATIIHGECAFPVHRAILAAGSPVMRSHFAPEATSSLTVPEAIRRADLEILIRSFYRLAPLGRVQCDGVNASNCVSLLKLAHRYGAGSLLVSCGRFMFTSMPY